MSYGSWAGRATYGDEPRTWQSPKEQVYRQLAEDFPPGAIAWVKSASWEGPEDVPLEQVDFEGKAGWQASREPEKVAEFAQRISGGWGKPIVLVRRPGFPELMVVDGHHRALAYEQLDEPAFAYVATVRQDRGPWDQMHERQRTTADGSFTARSPTPGSNLRP